MTTTATTDRPIEVVLDNLIRVGLLLVHLPERGHALLVVTQRPHAREVGAMSEAGDVHKEVELRERESEMDRDRVCYRVRRVSARCEAVDLKKGDEEFKCAHRRVKW